MVSTFVEPGVPLVVFWILVGSAIIIQGISKSGFAGGAGVLSLPLMMLVMPVDKVAATMLPLLILCDMNAIYIHRRNVVWSKVMAIFIPSIAGIILGAAVWWWVGRQGIQEYAGWIKRFVGVIAIFMAVYIIGKETAMGWVEGWRPGPVAAWLFGIPAGFCSTIAHASGPIVSLFLFAHNLGKTVFVGSVAWTFTLINLTKLPFYVAVGLVKTDVLLFDLFLVWLIPIGSYLGKWMHHRVSESAFNWTIVVLTILAGIQLLSGFDVIQLLFGTVIHVK